MPAEANPDQGGHAQTQAAPNGTESRRPSNIHLDPDSNINYIANALQNAKSLYDDVQRGEKHDISDNEVELACLCAELVKLMNAEYIAKEVIIRGIAYMREKGLPPRSAINHAKRDRRLLHPKMNNGLNDKRRNRQNGAQVDGMDQGKTFDEAIKDNVFQEEQNQTSAATRTVSGSSEKTNDTGTGEGNKAKKRYWNNRRGKKHTQTQVGDNEKVEVTAKDDATTSGGSTTVENSQSADQTSQAGEANATTASGDAEKGTKVE